MQTHLLALVVTWFLPVTKLGSEPGMVSKASSQVLSGIDILHREKYAPLRGHRVGLITNQTGIDRTGARTVDRLREAPGVQLKALFSPEHGFYGTLDIPEIADDRDADTGLRVFSLYGKTRKPTHDMLEGI